MNKVQILPKTRREITIFTATMLSVLITFSHICKTIVELYLLLSGKASSTYSAWYTALLDLGIDIILMLAVYFINSVTRTATKVLREYVMQQERNDIIASNYSKLLDVFTESEKFNK